MSVEELHATTTEGVLTELPSSGLRYLARQPILDLNAKVHGYELLFRSGPEANFRGDGDIATRIMLDNTVLFGLERLTGGLPAFVNCTRESLTERLVDVLPTGMTVLEILEDIEPTPDLIATCHKLKVAGFRLALDDFVWMPKFEPLVEMADYIKIDFTLTGPAERQKLMHRLSCKAVAFVAEKVETQQECEQARKEGFTLFQGYYFCRPVLIKNSKIPANHIFQIQILRLLQNEPMDLRKLSQLVKQDASLTYRLMRLANSPVSALRQKVCSIHAALVAVGEIAFRRIATLAITSELSVGQPPEILRTAIVRGRFCELAAGLCAMDSAEQYLLGMFSLLPAMMRVPMEELTPLLPLRDEIRQALEGKLNLERRLLLWLEHHENGNWHACDKGLEFLGLEREKVAACYSEAILWAENAFQSTK